MYCKICESCGEDGCCPATVCQMHQDGKYCRIYLKELKFSYLMFRDTYSIIEKYDKKKLDEIFDKNYDLIWKKEQD